MASSAASGTRPVFVVTGPSGAGKGTLEREVLRLMPELELAVSATTRERRPGERDGREYWFLTPEEFEERVRRGDFLEHVDYVSGHRYGTLRSELDRIAGEGRIPLLDLEIEGARRVQDELPGAVAIFVKAPSFVVNDRVDRARDELATIVRREIENAGTMARRDPSTHR